ncbi:hypothetical protein [Streptomyces sp. NPDC097981]|uniref:hypothetical protein n=1 Tax=Streptomyces sp. NPDC097981 TaxID=3155428 RepID=UPI00331DE95B
MLAAFMLQVEQSEADAEWMQSLHLPADTENEILIRLSQRGGVWLDFLTTCLGYKGDFRGFSEELRKAREGIGR